MTKVDRNFALSDYREEYLTLLSPLFLQLDRVDTVEYVCALIRAGGMEDAGWDPLEESRAFVNDLTGLIQGDLATGTFADPEITRLANGARRVRAPRGDGCPIRRPGKSPAHSGRPQAFSPALR